MTKRLRKITKIDLPISIILKIIFTDECINVSKWHSLYVNIFFPSIANLKCTPSDRKGSPKGTCIPVTWQISTVFFWWLSLPATHFTSIYRITVLHILHFIPRVNTYTNYYTLFPLHWKQLRLWKVCSLNINTSACRPSTIITVTLDPCRVAQTVKCSSSSSLRAISLFAFVSLDTSIF